MAAKPSAPSFWQNDKVFSSSPPESPATPQSPSLTRISMGTCPRKHLPWSGNPYRNSVYCVPLDGSGPGWVWTLEAYAFSTRRVGLIGSSLLRENPLVIQCTGQHRVVPAPESNPWLGMATGCPPLPTLAFPSPFFYKSPRPLNASVRPRPRRGRTLALLTPSPSFPGVRRSRRNSTIHVE
jgi:hypothetical protein